MRIFLVLVLLGILPVQVQVHTRHLITNDNKNPGPRSELTQHTRARGGHHKDPQASNASIIVCPLHGVSPQRTGLPQDRWLCVLPRRGVAEPDCEPVEG